MLTAVVAVGAAGDSAFAPPRSGRPDPTTLLYVLAAALTLSVVGTWAVRSLRIGGGPVWPGAGGTSRPVSVREMVSVTVTVAALLGLLGISVSTMGVDALRDGVAGQAIEEGGGREGRLLNFLDDRTSPVRAGEGTGPRVVPELDRRPVPLAAALLVLVAGAAALAWWVGKRGDSVVGGSEGDVDARIARESVLRSIDAMLADPDPNTAVIGAYARLLEGMAAAGVPRRDYEAPVEHLRRALSHLRVPAAPVERLVSLFEIARFSTHELTLQHRKAALQALQDVAADLEGDPVGAGRVRASSSEPT